MPASRLSTQQPHFVTLYMESMTNVEVHLLPAGRMLDLELSRRGLQQRLGHEGRRLKLETHAL
jgi:hypothetical protein